MKSTIMNHVSFLIG